LKKTGVRPQTPVKIKSLTTAKIQKLFEKKLTSDWLRLLRWEMKNNIHQNEPVKNNPPPKEHLLVALPFLCTSSASTQLTFPSCTTETRHLKGCSVG